MLPFPGIELPKLKMFSGVANEMSNSNIVQLEIVFIAATSTCKYTGLIKAQQMIKQLREELDAAKGEQDSSQEVQSLRAEVKQVGIAALVEIDLQGLLYRRVTY